jgi:hypothetical protein
MARDAGVEKGTSERVASQRLAPLGEQMLSLVYRRLVADSKSHGLCTGFVFLPMVPDMAYSVDVTKEIQIAKDEGFTVLDLSGVYDVPDRNSLWVAAWDAHPNARAHRLVADKLFRLVQDNRAALLSCDAPEAPVAASPTAANFEQRNN